MSSGLYELQQTTMQGRGEVAFDILPDRHNSNSESDNSLKSSCHFFLFNVNFPTTAFVWFMLIYLKNVRDRNAVLKYLYWASDDSVWVTHCVFFKWWFNLAIKGKLEDLLKLLWQNNINMYVYCYVTLHHTSSWGRRGKFWENSLYLNYTDWVRLC